METLRFLRRDCCRPGHAPAIAGGETTPAIPPSERAPSARRRQPLSCQGL